MTPGTVACQAPLSMGFLRQEYWSEFPFHPARNLPDPEINQGLQVDSSPSEPPMKPELDDSYMYCRKNSKKYNSSTTHDENMKKNFLSVFQNVSFAECVSVGGGVGLYQSFSLVIGCLLDLRKLGGFQASFQTEHLWEVLFQVSVLMSLISDFSWSKLNTHTHTHTHTHSLLLQAVCTEGIGVFLGGASVQTLFQASQLAPTFSPAT